MMVQKYLKRMAQHVGMDTSKKIVQTALNLSSLQLLNRLHLPFLPEEAEAVETVFQRVCRHEPLSRILSQRGFWKEDFFLNAATLDPRPETEGLIEHSLSFFKNHHPPEKILDLGTGSGCILLSLLQEFPQAWGLGVDCQEAAISAAAYNSQRLNLNSRAAWLVALWLQPFALSLEKFDLVVSNPPYIPSGDLVGLDPAVRDFDPWTALDGGSDGLESYRALIPPVSAILSKKGLLILEIGWDQGEDLLKLLAPYFSKTQLRKDLAGHDRYILAQI